MPTYESHVTTSAVFDKPARIEYPFGEQGDVATKIVYQPLLQLADRYVAPTIGGAFSDALANFSGSPVSIGTAYCIGDSAPQLVEAGLVSFTRGWANIPATSYDYALIPVTFPALRNMRPSFSAVVMSKVSTEYYRVQAATTYATPDNLPVAAISNVTSTSGIDVPLLSSVELNNFLTGIYATDPSIDDYQSASTYSIVVDCKIERWKGNIWKVITSRVTGI